MTTAKTILKALSSPSFINVALIKAFGAESAIFLSQLIEWGGFERLIAKTPDDWELATGLKPRGVGAAAARLAKVGVIEIDRQASAYRVISAGLETALSAQR